MDRRTLGALVEAALENLYDRAALGDSALRQHLATEERPLTAERLHRILVAAIEALRPAPGSPTTSPGWRRYHYLSLRYLEGMSHKATAGQLGLSLRQAHRVRTEAIQVLADALWPGEADESAGDLRSREHRAPPSGGMIAPARLTMTLEDELARLDPDAHGSPAEVNREIAAIAEIIRPLTDQHGIAVHLELAAENAPVAVPRSVLRQVLVLLITYGLAIPGSRRLIVTTVCRDGQVIIDLIAAVPMVPGTTGEPEHDPRLTTARRLIEAEGGALEVLALGDGPCFRLTLPPPKTRTILTIDDNPDLARLFDLYLQGTSYQVIRAKTAQSALRLAEKHRPDVVTLDVMMPFQDGWEIFRQLRDNPLTRSIPIVVCSILPERELALALGAADFLPKPVTRQSLLDTLRRCLAAGSRESSAPV